MARNPLLPSSAQVREFLLRSGVMPADVQRKNSPNVDIEGQDIPEPAQPQMEGRPTYIPYRGGEMHGVIPPNPLEETAEGYTGGKVDVHESDAHEHVLPVRIVHGDEGESIAAWRATQLVAPVAGNPPIQVAPRQRSRTKLKLENIAAGDGCWIGADVSISALNGYYLAPGASVDLSTTEAAYAISATPNPVPIAILTEFTQAL